MHYEIEQNYSLAENESGIIKVYKQKLPALRFIGKNYGCVNHPDWGDAFGTDVFGKIERASGDEKKILTVYEDANAFLGLHYRNAEADGYDGWIGMFTFPDTPVPDGLGHIDFPEQNLGVCWIYGSRDEVYGHVSQCPDYLRSAGMEIRCAGEGYLGFFERDLCPRYTIPDEKGNIILDYCYFVK